MMVTAAPLAPQVGASSGIEMPPVDMALTGDGAGDLAEGGGTDEPVASVAGDTGTAPDSGAEHEMPNSGMAANRT